VRGRSTPDARLNNGRTTAHSLSAQALAYRSLPLTSFRQLICPARVTFVTSRPNDKHKLLELPNSILVFPLKICFLKYPKRRYRIRSRIEIMFGRLEDCRVATRYDRYPTVLFSAVTLATIFWL